MMSTPPFQPPRGCLWPSLILGGMCCAVGGLSLLAIPRMWQRSREVWTETAGVVVEPYVETGKRLDRVTDERSRRTGNQIRVETEKATYHVRLKYRYSITSQEYAGDAPAPHQPENDEEAQQAKEILPMYPAGKGLAVFHHPAKVSESRLTQRESATEFGFDLVFAIAFLLIGISLFSFGRWVSRSSLRRSG